MACRVRAGIKVGIVGLVEEEWLETLGAVNVADMQYKDFIEVGRAAARDLKVRTGRGVWQRARCCSCDEAGRTGAGRTGPGRTAKITLYSALHGCDNAFNEHLACIELATI